MNWQITSVVTFMVLVTNAHAALVSQWDFETYTNSTVVDQVGDVNLVDHYKYDRVKLVGDGQEKWGNYALHSSAGDFLDSTSTASYSTTAGTYEFWVKVNDQKALNDYLLLSHIRLAGGITMSVRFNGENKLIVQTPFGSDITPGNANITRGQWHMINLTYDAVAEQVRFYIDAILQGTSSYSDINAENTDLFRFGSGYSTSPDVLLDNASFYNSALTQAEISNNIPEPTVIMLLLAGNGLLIRTRRRLS